MDCTARVREFPSWCRRDGGRLTLALAAPASAQYFGRNTVLYKPFDFKVLKTEHFDIHPELVRGYDVGTFQAADCLPAAASGCPALDQLMGTACCPGLFIATARKQVQPRKHEDAKTSRISILRAFVSSWSRWRRDKCQQLPRRCTRSSPRKRPDANLSK